MGQLEAMSFNKNKFKFPLTKYHIRGFKKNRVKLLNMKIDSETL